MEKVRLCSVLEQNAIRHTTQLSRPLCCQPDMATLQVVLSVAILMTEVFAAPQDPTGQPDQSPFNLYQYRWMSKDSDPGPPQPSNFYPRPSYIAPRVHTSNYENPFPVSSVNQQTNGYPFGSDGSK
ncbi:hypothetical protein L9F63_008767 [Diploptera punctata]|uniref:Uncharacterized protein n=1 Tax=Diploptera punctata TaxID=6984 RepID=A0AAD7Z4L7_DIPPU|nr:hypothetical protein L9F63_008767 [Diploptera punctata]